MRIGIDCRMYSSKFTGIGRVNFELIKYLQKLDKENKRSIRYLKMLSFLYNQETLVNIFLKTRTIKIMLQTK